MNLKTFVKKGLAVGLVLMMGVTGLVGCGQEDAQGSKDNAQVTDQKGSQATGNKDSEATGKVTLKAVTNVDPTNGDFNTMKIMQQIEENTGVDVEFECIAWNVWGEKKNLIFASNQLPDFFFGGGLTDTDINMYSQQGLLVPLDDLIEAHAPNVKAVLEKYPHVKKALTSPDGHIYTLPFFDEFEAETIPETYFINKTWLDNLGLPVPTTTEEFYTTLQAFKTQDPNGNGAKDEIPFTYMANNMYNGDASLMASYGVIDNYQHLEVRDGKVVFSPMRDEYKEGIKWVNKLYTEGLVDAEVFTQDYSQYIAKGKNEETIVGVFSTYADENYVGEEKAYSDYITLEPLKGPNGDQSWCRYDLGVYFDKFAITNTNADPAATMKFIDECFEEEISMQLHWGLIGENLAKEGDKYTFMTPPEGKSIDEFRFQNCPGPYAPGIMTAEMYDKLQFAPDKERKIERYEIYDQYAITETMPVIRFKDEELAEISVIATDIDNYVKQMKAQWITGQSNIDDEWDNYLEQLKMMSVDRYVEIYQAGYDRAK